jgi:hypothetical protein
MIVVCWQLLKLHGAASDRKGRHGSGLLSRSAPVVTPPPDAAHTVLVCKWAGLAVCYKVTLLPLLQMR